MGSKNTTLSSPSTPSAETATDTTRSINSQNLLQGHQEVCIKHENQIYRLRVTRQGKLILTK